MFALRPANERGVANIGWLDSRHTFSFGSYHDPEFMGFGPLRVINEDRVQPGRGFDTHGHRDMEIISYVLNGALEHRDSMGNGSIIRPGDVQRMTAGTGIRHSEINGSATDEVHFLQIWILPERDGLTPSYEQKSFSDFDLGGRLTLAASGDGRHGSVTIHQDADLYIAKLSASDEVGHDLGTGRIAWLQVAAGEVDLGEVALAAGDGVAIDTAQKLQLTTRSNAQVLLFDMAG